MEFRRDHLEDLIYANSGQEQMRANSHLELVAGQFED
jgi:hypothetical protein